MLLKRFPTVVQPTSGSVVTLGNFDGVHLGHRELLKRVTQHSVKSACASVVVSFYPHPGRVFNSKRAPFQLLSLRQKVRELSLVGIDLVYLIRFSQAYATTTAEFFIEDVLVQRLGCKVLVVGEDAAIGHKRSGDICYLKEMLPNYGIELEVVGFEQLDSVRVSSAEIRSALGAGEMERVNTLLGRSYDLSGRVEQGEQRGRTIGFPTANISVKPSVMLPKRGVYISEVLLPDAKSYLPAVTNIGVRPTLSGEHVTVETHLLNFESRNLYGQRISVRLLKYIRSEIKFGSLSQLTDQIELDCAAAREFFSR